MSVYGNYIRAATTEEVKDFWTVEDRISDYDTEAYEALLSLVQDFYFAHGKEKKKLYRQVYRIAKRFGVTIKAMVNWYFTDLA